MESVLAVEKELDKALDSFETFYDGIDDDLNKVIDNVTNCLNEIIKGK